MGPGHVPETGRNLSRVLAGVGETFPHLKGGSIKNAQSSLLSNPELFIIHLLSTVHAACNYVGIGGTYTLRLQSIR